MKILLHAPSNTIAGGSESIHQLCDALTESFETYICYHPKPDSKVPSKFQVYKINPTNYFDDEDTIHIIPETNINYFDKKIKKGTKVIFWLSVDNYLGLKDYNPIFKIIKYLKSFKNRISSKKLKKCYHLTQSEYANIFLNKKKITYYFLGDYINESYLNLDTDNKNKENIIIYNPRKGVHFTEKIMNKNKFKFIAIKNMNNNEIIELMKKSKIYIDFGRLPGRDRIPREAVLLDNILIIGKRGSGFNDKDFPINNKYKIDTKKRNFVENLNDIIEYSLYSYQKTVKDFKKFKDELNAEKDNFKVRAKKSLDDLIRSLDN